MSLTKFSLRELLQNAVHFGHKSARRNPKMMPYIYSDKNGISIIDLAKTKFLLKSALEEIKKIASRNGKILFVGTKEQASDCIKISAQGCTQFYVNHRWLGGTLTNWKTVSSSIYALEKLEKRLEVDGDKLTKKETVDLEMKIIKLQKVLNGIRKMKGLPHMIFVIDANKEKLAILEAKKLNIPVVAVVDTNTSPEGIDHIIPGNDDSKNSINLICRLVQGAVLEGLKQHYDTQKIEEEKTLEKELKDNTLDEKTIKNEKISTDKNPSDEKKETKVKDSTSEKK